LGHAERKSGDYERDPPYSAESQNTSQVVETRTQSNGVNSSTIAQENVGTPTADYISFPVINTTAKTSSGAPADYSSIRGVWGKSVEAQKISSSQAQYFRQVLLSTVVIANLNPTARHKLIDFMRQRNVYTTDFTKVSKTKLKGRAVYDYPVKIDAKAYFSMLQEFSILEGLGKIPGLDLSKYDAAAPLSATFTVDINSRQLTNIHYDETSQDEAFTSYGITSQIKIPAKTIPVDELQKRLQAVH
jgi:hypothetical protein